MFHRLTGGARRPVGRGLVAQSLAVDHPERVAALVLCGTAAKIGDAATWDARIEAAEYKGLDTLAGGTMERWFTRAHREREPDAVTGWRAILSRQPAQGYAATCAAIRDADLRAAVPGITAPPDLACGTAALIPGADLTLVPEAGHISCVEQPAFVVDRILEHLARAGCR